MKTQDNIDQVSDSNESNTEKNKTNENRGDLQGTLYNDILRIARNLLETRENIKIETYPFYHIICD